MEALLAVQRQLCKVVKMGDMLLSMASLWQLVLEMSIFACQKPVLL